MLLLYLVKHNALFALITLLIAKKYVFSSGGSEKKRLITAFKVMTKMVSFPMTLTDPEPGFQGHGVFEVECLKNGAF